MGSDAGPLGFGTLAISQRSSSWTRVPWRQAVAPAVGAWMGTDGKLHPADDDLGRRDEAEQDAELAKSVRERFAQRLQLEAEQARMQRDERRAERAARQAGLGTEGEGEDDDYESEDDGTHIRSVVGKTAAGDSADFEEEEEYDEDEGEDEGAGGSSALVPWRRAAEKKRGKGGMEIMSDDEEEPTEEDRRMIVGPGALDDDGTGALVPFTAADAAREEAAVKAIARGLVQSRWGTAAAFPDPADADMYAMLNEKVEKSGRGKLTGGRGGELHHMDRLERLLAASEARQKKALDEKVIDLAAAAGDHGFSSAAAEYAASLVRQNEAAGSSLQKDAPSSYGYSKETSRDADGMDDGTNRSWDEIQAMYAARYKKKQAEKEAAVQAALRATEARPSLAFNGAVGDEEMPDVTAGRVGVPASAAAAAAAEHAQHAPPQAIDPATAASRWATGAAARLAGSESLPAASGGAQCAPRKPLPYPLQFKADGNLVFQVACFEMIVDAILRYICTGGVTPSGIRFDVVDPRTYFERPGAPPTGRKIAWSAALRHASCTPHMLRADEQKYATMVASESQLDEECKQQLRASARTEDEGMLLLTSPDQLRLVVTLATGAGTTGSAFVASANHTFVAVGTAAELPSLIAAQVGEQLGVPPTYRGSLDGCNDMMSMMVPKPRAPPKKSKKRPGGGAAERPKKIGGPCPGAAARLINEQAAIDASKRDEDMDAVTQAAGERPELARALSATPAVATVGGTTVPGIELAPTAHPPTATQVAAVGGREFLDVTHLGDADRIVDLAMRRLSQEGAAGASASMADVAQAQRAVQHREAPLTEKRHVLAIWRDMDPERPYDLTQDLEKKLGQTVNVLGRRLLSDQETFLEAVTRVAPTVADLLRGRNRETVGDPYHESVLRMIKKHSSELAKPETEHLAKTTAAYMTAFHGACTAAYLKPSTLAQRRGGGKAAMERPKVGAPALTMPPNEFGNLFGYLLQQDPTDPTMVEV